MGHAFQAVEIFNEQMLELHEGQGMEIFWRDNFTCPNQQKYEETVIKSTTFSLIIRPMHVCDK